MVFVHNIKALTRTGNNFHQILLIAAILLSTSQAKYLLFLILTVEGTLLLALLAGDRRAILLLGVRASLTLIVDKTSDNVAVATRSWLAIQFHVLLTLLANCRSATPAANIRYLC